MTKMRRYDYADEKLTQARGTLMAPHGRGGEDGAFVGAFEIISRLQPRDVSDLPEPASDYWAKISALMESDGLDDPKKEGTHTIRVRQMTFEHRHEFSRNVEELASWLSDWQHQALG